MIKTASKLSKKRVKKWNREKEEEEVITNAVTVTFNSNKKNVSNVFVSWS